jgi:hypothetical protein
MDTSLTTGGTGFLGCHVPSLLNKLLLISISLTCSSSEASDLPHEFSATTNYMSRGGYERWRTYQKTGVWWSGTTYIKNDVQFLTSDYAASLALQIAKKAFKEYPYTRSFFISGNLRMFGLEWDDHYPFGVEYRRDQRKLYSDYVYRVQEGEKVELRLHQADNKRKIN